MSDRIPLTRRYLKSVITYWQAFTAMLFCMVCIGLLQPILPWMLAPLLDAGNTGKQHAIPSEWLPYFMLLTILLLGTFSYGRSYLGGWLDSTLQRDYRSAMATHLLQLPLGTIQQQTSGKLTSRFMLFLPQMTGATLPVCMALVQETIKAAGYIALMLYWQWQLTLIVLLVAPIGAGCISILGKRMKKVATKIQEETASTQNNLNETINAARIIKIGGETSAVNRLNKPFAALRRSSIRTHIILSAGQPLTHILTALPFAIVIGYIISALAKGTMSAGSAASFLTIMLLLPTPVRIITRALHQWEQMLAAAREIYGFLDTPRENAGGNTPLAHARGDITFEHISFHYPAASAAAAQPVLRDLSLTIAAGETIALVGHSGSGKTTLCNLLPRFYTVSKGRLLIDNSDIRDYTLADLRRQFALVPQQPLLFDDSIAMNVTFPDTPEANSSRLTAALTAAAADDFVAALPEGTATRIGENGNLLSGGQQQRLMLARAFYRDAPIIILDEATSALDSENESKIKTAMRRLFTNRTAIIIAHRLSTIDFADRIIMLSDGKIIADGSLADLRRNCPPFAALYEAQQLA